MSDISAELEKIQKARYGRDVRQSIHDAIKNIDEVADIAKDSATAKATEAATSADTASKKATAADTSATTAESWAQGGTESREGEDTNNAKYYSEQSAASNTEAAASATTASEKATLASTKAEEASASASTADSKATEASASATTAAEKAEIATTKASEASASATTASDKADVATAKADEASASATTASTKATEASASATTAAEKAALAETNAKAIAEIEAIMGYSDGDIVGLQVDYKNKTFKRLAGAVGKSQGADFDQYTMFGGRMRCNVADNGTINAWYGDSGYVEDGSNGQVMVYQPKFYYTACPLELDANSTGIGYHLRKANYYVSSLPHTGFKVHPAFIDADGKEVDYYLDSAYEASIYDTSASAYLLSDEQVADFTADKLCSIAVARPASGVSQNLTRPNVEALAQVRGTNWHGDLVKQVSARQLLMIIEAGTMNTQSAYGQGVVNIPWTTGSDTTSSYAAATGSTASLGNASGRASETTTYEGGTTTKYTIDGKTSVSWRGSENCWGNIWKFVYGINIYGNGSMGGGQPYICTDYTFAESKNSDNYEGAGFTVTNANGYISAMGYSESYDWLLIASECSGNSSLPVGDYNYVTSNLNGYRIAQLGGGWDGSAVAGGFFWSLRGGVGARARSIGARLVFMPTYGSTSYTTAINSWKTKMG